MTLTIYNISQSSESTLAGSMYGLCKGYFRCVETFQQSQGLGSLFEHFHTVIVDHKYYC